MHNPASRARSSRSLWHQSIDLLRQTAPSPLAGERPIVGDATSASIDIEKRDGSKGGKGDLRWDLRESLFAVATVSGILRRIDLQTHNHSERVARHALRLAQLVGLDSEEFPALQLGALLHDCGKIGVSAQILNKPGVLTGAEFDEVKKHPMHGVAILDAVPLLHGAIPIVRHHHERFDGRGYPDGLGGDLIPFAARIVAIADAFDAMVSDRPYRRGVSAKEARGILCLNGGAQFDPDLVDAFVSDQIGDT